ncbi:hypothetical protein P5673_004995 [Acropora cervicornis]|uniref:Uncharacterized protein n=1 Tax=Acropora cervicornis TaxID=6130 RepID=A0AAD9QZP8_ACRCE|nr:hypothetical protein P5673_004995 [Acropora cervicornis]
MRENGLRTTEIAKGQSSFPEVYPWMTKGLYSKEDCLKKTIWPRTELSTAQGSESIVKKNSR